MQYYAEPPHDRSLPVDKSPIPYRVAKKDIWPQLAAMALDIYSVPAMSDEPERIFSQTGPSSEPHEQVHGTAHVYEKLVQARSCASGRQPFQKDGYHDRSFKYDRRVCRSVGCV